jgi:hypothetical protein
MKHILKFNESIDITEENYIKLFETSRTDKLKQFCNDNLAYLIDDGFSVDIKLSTNPTITYNSFFEGNISYTRSKLFDSILIDRRNIRGDKMFNFEDVIDDIIPFILTLNEKYTVKDIIYTYSTKGAKRLKNFVCDVSYLEENLVHEPNMTYPKVIRSIIVIVNKY